MEAIKKIGQLQYDKMQQAGKGLLDGFTQDVSGGGRYNKCLEIIIEKINDKYQYKEINLREYDDDLKMKYLYRSGSSRGTDVTPTAKVTGISKTLNGKIIKAIPEAIKFGGEKYKEETEILKSISKAIDVDIDKIKEDLENAIKDIPKKEGKCITVTLKENEDYKYIGDFKLFKEKVVQDALKKFHYSATNKKDVYNENGVCSLCRKETKDIYGLVCVFPFYTIDKRGYISGLNYEHVWKNYPVCKECAVYIELGKTFLDNNLTFSFYGRRYYLIPKPIYNDKLEKILKKYRTLKSNDVKDVKDKYSSVEERVLRVLGNEESSISFDLMFFEKSNAALNILLNIEDVAPSRFSKIYNGLEIIRQMKFFEDKRVSFQILNMVFPSDKYNRYFLDIIDKIISNRKIDYNFIMRFFNNHIIEAFNRFERENYPKDKDSYSTATFRVFGFLYYLDYLNMFRRRESEIMDLNENVWLVDEFDSKEQMFNDFFKKSKPFFNDNGKKAVFLIGYVARKLLKVQNAKESRKPFMVRLKGLKLTKKDIVRLVPEIQGKLMEYKSEYYNDELNLISQYLISSNSLKKLADQDIPFYFSLGMNMTDNFKSEKTNKG